MTPTEIDNDVKKLIDIICPNSSPIYLAVEPESYAQVKECFQAVAEKIRRDGGSRVLGWQIWKTDILLEAEFHAVWKSPEGELKDITPKQPPQTRILFLADSKVKYNGAQIDNHRKNISDNRLVDDFIEIEKSIFRIENKGKRAFQHEFELSKNEGASLDTLQKMKTEVEFMVKNGMTRNRLCFCGSHNKYKHCHGKKLTERLKSYTE